MRAFQIFLVALLAFVSLVASSRGQQRLKFGTFDKTHPISYLPVLAAEEKGLWKKNGLEAEWVPFRSSADMSRGMAAGSLSLGISTGASVLQAASGGLPAVIVSELHQKDYFSVWVPVKSRIKEAKDLKGIKLSSIRRGGTQYAYTKMVLKALGLEKDVRLVVVGSSAAEFAALKTGVVDALPVSIFRMVEMEIKGEVRKIITYDDYLPREWLVHVVVSDRRLVSSEADLVRRTVTTLLQAADAIRGDRRWSVDKMKAISGYSELAAGTIYDLLRFTKTGKIERKALENVFNFLKEYEIVSKEWAPNLDEFYTNRFIG